MEEFNDSFTETMLEEYNLTQQEKQSMREYAQIMGVLQDAVHELNVIKDREKDYLQIRNKQYKIFITNNLFLFNTLQMK